MKIDPCQLVAAGMGILIARTVETNPAVIQSPFFALTSFLIHKSDFLKARVIIYSYNDHVGSFRALVVKQPQFTRVEGADILMKSSDVAPLQSGPLWTAADSSKLTLLLVGGWLSDLVHLFG
jgi:hypothetical protein